MPKISKCPTKIKKTNAIHQARINFVLDQLQCFFRFNESFYKELRDQGINRAATDSVIETLIEQDLIEIVDDGTSLIFKRKQLVEGLDK